MGGVERQSELNATSDAWEASNDVTREAGFDVKYNLSSNLTLDATFNTDFAQVEADNQQVNLTRFPLFFPEKRQFFQERASIFSFDLGGRDQLFFSRRIGLDAGGRPIRIWGGGRLTGRTGMDLGLINMQTADSENLPSESFVRVAPQAQGVQRKFLPGRHAHKPPLRGRAQRGLRHRRTGEGDRQRLRHDPDAAQSVLRRADRADSGATRRHRFPAGGLVQPAQRWFLLFGPPSPGPGAISIRGWAL
ncbi:MAG: DUF5916 domain-containing protein [Balneolaceae bacterium]|nr:DUF5916 domain-containing protein [Balneolaceae bacterium]